MPVIRLDGVSKIYKSERRKKFPAVSDINLTILQGEFVFIVGSSGSGKSTILRLITGSLRPSHGNVYLNHLNISKLAPWSRKKLRRFFGHVHQQPQLSRYLTVGESFMSLAQRSFLGGEATRREKVSKALGLVGIFGVENKYPGDLTVNQTRRVELARALINSPPILVVDEMSVGADDDTTWDLMQLLREINQQGTTVIMATHASSQVNIMRKRVITLVDGRIVADIPRGKYGDITGKTFYKKS